MNIVSNLLFHCNNCDANRVLVKFRESTAAAPRSGLLNAKFTFKGKLFINRTDSEASECLATLSLTVCTQRNFVADFLQAKCDFTGKTAVLCFERPFRGLGKTYDVNLRVTVKRVVDFLLVSPIAFAVCINLRHLKYF